MVKSVISDSFAGKLANKRIVLYGKGPQTEKLIRYNEQLNIVGIMDRDIHEGELWGAPIFNNDDIKSGRADIIIVVARPESVPIVYERIGQLCSDNHVMLYD